MHLKISLEKNQFIYSISTMQNRSQKIAPTLHFTQSTYRKTIFNKFGDSPQSYSSEL